MYGKYVSFPLLIDSADVSLLSSMKPEVMWHYLCCHLDVERLQLWIETQYPISDAQPSQASWPYCMPLPLHFLDELGQCTARICEQILDFCARYFKLVVIALNNIPRDLIYSYKNFLYDCTSELNKSLLLPFVIYINLNYH